MTAAIVRLPTAAPRKVDNHRWAAQRRAGLALYREQGAFPRPLSSNRDDVLKAERLADYMESHPMSATTAIIMGLIKQLKPDQLEALCLSVMGSADAMTLIELAKADTRISHLVHVVLDRRGLQ